MFWKSVMSLASILELDQSSGLCGSRIRSASSVYYSVRENTVLFATASCILALLAGVSG